MTATDVVDDTAAPAKPKRRLLVPLLVVAVLLAATAGVTVLYLRQAEATRVEAARAEATRAAAEQIPEVLSYSHDTLDRDFAAAARAVTGPFARDYLELQRTAIRPAATRDRITTRTTVSALGVVTATDDEVVLLAFINQLTTSSRHPTPLIEGARIRTTLTKTPDNTWRISTMDTI
ncbi:hypothetical protein [Saccharopolyspora flava]|uniref:Mce-associated membrane protein n=1 Tax=Saccharopolyspora flava TaxID=95161 RepID=A0A1I6S4L9_9PSEU|nr:hypothetical protein [Saccharopolyspora flava]SFS71882.1 Mce-associated membrane protein [Saccharopolyspora flava]